MRRLAIAIAATWLLASSASAQGAAPAAPAASPQVPQQEQTPQPQLRADWLERDLAMARLLATLLPPDGAQLATLLALLDPGTATDAAREAARRLPEPDENRDLGFGAKRLILPLYGGHASTWLTVVVCDGRPAAAFARCRADRATWPALATHLLPLLPAGARRTDDGVEWRWSDPARLAALRAAVAAGCGDGGRTGGASTSSQPEPPQPDVAAAFATLMDPLQVHVFGDECGDDGAPPDGRRATTTLLGACRIDLVRDVLRSPNPEARVYAADALLRLRAHGLTLTDADRAAIDAIRALDVAIRNCTGCTILEGKAAALLSR